MVKVRNWRKNCVVEFGYKVEEQQHVSVRGAALDVCDCWCCEAAGG